MELGFRNIPAKGAKFRRGSNVVHGLAFLTFSKSRTKTQDDDGSIKVVKLEINLSLSTITLKNSPGYHGIGVRKYSSDGGQMWSTG